MQFHHASEAYYILSAGYNREVYNCVIEHFHNELVALLVGTG